MTTDDTRPLPATAAGRDVLNDLDGMAEEWIVGNEERTQSQAQHLAAVLAIEEQARGFWQDEYNALAARHAALVAALLEVVGSLVPRYDPLYPEDHGFSPATAAAIRAALASEEAERG